MVVINVQDIDPDGLEELRLAIVWNAVKEYDAALKYLRKHSTSPDDSCKAQKRQTKTECEDFFKSQWYEILFDIDGLFLMKIIRTKFYNRPIHKLKPMIYGGKRWID